MDDISQMVVGTVICVAHFLDSAVLAYVAVARAVKLCIVDPASGKTKSTLVASHPRIMAEVTLALKAVGIAVSFTRYDRDLGLLLSVHRRGAYMSLHLVSGKEGAAFDRRAGWRESFAMLVGLSGLTLCLVHSGALRL